MVSILSRFKDIESLAAPVRVFPTLWRKGGRPRGRPFCVDLKMTKKKERLQNFNKARSIDWCYISLLLSISRASARRPSRSDAATQYPSQRALFYRNTSIHSFIQVINPRPVCPINQSLGGRRVPQHVVGLLRDGHLGPLQQRRHLDLAPQPGPVV